MGIVNEIQNIPIKSRARAELWSSYTSIIFTMAYTHNGHMNN